MESREEVVEIDELERSLLPGTAPNEDAEPAKDDGEEPVIYTASFEEAEENFVKYQTARWVMYSLFLILAWGIGLLMLLYLPVRRYVLRKDVRSRKLYVTSNAIVYKVTRPVAFPCFGVLKKEKHILLPSVADIVIEQVETLSALVSDTIVEFPKLYTESFQKMRKSRYGVYSIRIENAGVRRPSRDDVHIQGIANPHAFRKAVLMHLLNMKREAFSREASVVEDAPNLRTRHSSVPSMSPSKSFRHDSLTHSGEQVILHKLEEVGSSVKRLQSLIEGQHPQTSESID